MAETELTFGSVPPFYREVYEIVCPAGQQHIDRDMFVELLVKASLPKQTLSQIWDAVDRKQGFLTRNGLYKALALTALAQQGKTINEKFLETFQGQELPKPVLGDLSDLKMLSLRLRRRSAPNILGYTYSELIDLDTIKVELVPEKKGLILKHVLYEITSRRYKTTVKRRYNDFLAFQELLLQLFPYRMVPRLPPKKAMGADREFIEMRRRALKRFLTLVVRHPVLTDNAVVKYFLTFAGSDMQHKIKEHFRGTPDEFLSTETAIKAKDFVPMDTQQQFSNSREHVRSLLQSVSKIREVAERIVQRAIGYARDMAILGTELSSLGNDHTTVSSWACGTSETWSDLKQGFKHAAVEYGPLAEQASTQALQEAECVVEVLDMFLDLLYSYRDLCDRHEKGVLNDHQRALQKMGQIKKKQTSAMLQSPSESNNVEQLEHRILQQENELSNMENRNYFSLHCVQMETQLIHANLECLHIALQVMAREEARAHTQLSRIWESIKPVIDAILSSGEVANGSSVASPRAKSPIGDPSSTNG